MVFPVFVKNNSTTRVCVCVCVCVSFAVKEDRVQCEKYLCDKKSLTKIDLHHVLTNVIQTCCLCY